MDLARVRATGGGSPGGHKRRLLGLVSSSPCVLDVRREGSPLSPVTDLALNMTHLAGLGSNRVHSHGSQCDTPKRTRPAYLQKVPSFASDTSSDAGLGMDSPSPLDLVDMENIFEKSLVEDSVLVDNKMPIRRISSLPLLPMSPTSKGRDLEPCNYELTTGQSNKENVPDDVFEFKKPTRPVSRCNSRTTHGKEGREVLARRPNSAPELLSPDPVIRQHLLGDGSPVTLRRSSLTSSNEDDDGFLDILDSDVESDTYMPSGMASLLTAPLVAEVESTASPIICRPRGLFRSPSLPMGTRPAMKRLNRPRDEATPVQVKRRRSVAGTPSAPEDGEHQACRVIQRSQSLSQAEIEKLLDGDAKELIGDFSKPFVLPTVDGKHQDLKYITAEMMVAALNGQFDDVERIVVIDCRYPYEFEGGHIKGAVNLHQEDEVEEYLLKRPIAPSSPDKRVLLIFHCEFSSERGPRMCRFVRERDRELNEYPSLHYPELYVLKGGYKEFFPLFQTQCEPQDYRPMTHEDFKEDLRRFRLKSRSWAGERSKRDHYTRLKL
ncbi:M-phase inducer phosphatase 2-like [Scleropages formosus]|uniref:M-phase inducer phosphatase 2-like n=1 Tax=Scleropages formosus TaxID=113540 RepID=UPI0010FA695F|nr:M-phase inducer phosphatase 2 [Scleropages formosus]